MSKPQQFVLGIDLGSHGTRIALYDINEGKLKNVQERFERSHNLSDPWGPGDIPAFCYPFDETFIDGPSAVQHYRRIPLKVALAVLTDISDEEFDALPEGDRLRNMRHNFRFQEAILNSLKRHLEYCKSRVDEENRGREWIIQRCAMTYPSWLDDARLRKVYIGYVAEIFRLKENDIELVNEAEAIAHYLLRENYFTIKHDLGARETVLILDFGGTSMNGCLISVSYEESKKATPVAEIKAFGSVGGSEILEFTAARWLWEHLRMFHAKDITTDDLEDLRRQVKNTKQDLFNSFKYTPKDRDKTWRIEADPENVQKWLNAGFKACLEMAKHEIHEAYHKCRRSGGLGVILTGGSTGNKWLRSQITDFMADLFTNDEIRPRYDIKYLFTMDISVEYRSMQVARGAAYCVAQALTVEEFFDNGAALGVQLLEDPDNNNIWNDTALHIFSKNRSKWTSLSELVSCPIKIKIICDPHFLQRHGSPQALYYSDCYDLWEFPHVQNRHGRYSFNIERVQGDDSAYYLKFHMRYHGEGGRDETKATLRLRFQSGPSCALLEHDFDKGAVQMEAPASQAQMKGPGSQAHMVAKRLAPIITLTDDSDSEYRPEKDLRKRTIDSPIVAEQSKAMGRPRRGASQHVNYKIPTISLLDDDNDDDDDDELDIKPLSLSRAKRTKRN